MLSHCSVHGVTHHCMLVIPHAELQVPGSESAHAVRARIDAMQCTYKGHEYIMQETVISHHVRDLREVESSHAASGNDRAIVRHSP